jgi:hypothetical protein
LPAWIRLEFSLSAPHYRLGANGLDFADIDAMPKLNKSFLLILLPALLAGCTSITNLTPSQYPRDPSGFYRVEAEWLSQNATIEPESFKPVVMVDFNAYPMRPVPVVADRWEAFIPIPADKNYILYRYKFDFLESGMGKAHPNSQMSSGYELHISPAK